MIFPYISDDLSNGIIRIFNRYPFPLRLVTVPPPNLKKLLTRNRAFDITCVGGDQCRICSNGRIGDCTKKSVIYSILCEVCQVEYIGETARPLHIRIHEHVRSMNSPFSQSYMNMPLAKHAVASHGGRPFTIKVKLERIVGGTVQRKIQEALFIAKRRPALNERAEMLEFVNMVGLL